MINPMLDLFIKLRKEGYSEDEALEIMDKEKHYKYLESQAQLDSDKRLVRHLVTHNKVIKSLENGKPLLDWFPPSKNAIWKERMRKLRNS
jgi:hypothetical protein